MKDKAYLILNQNGIITLRKNRPTLAHGDFAVRLSVEVPDTVFDAYPEARLSISESDLIHPEVTAEVTSPEEPTPEAQGDG